MLHSCASEYSSLLSLESYIARMNKVWLDYEPSKHVSLNCCSTSSDMNNSLTWTFWYCHEPIGYGPLDNFCGLLRKYIKCIWKVCQLNVSRLYGCSDGFAYPFWKRNKMIFHYDNKCLKQRYNLINVCISFYISIQKIDSAIKTNSIPDKNDITIKIFPQIISWEGKSCLN